MIEEKSIIDNVNNIPLIVYFVDDVDDDGNYDCGEDVIYLQITSDEKRFPEIVQLNQVSGSDVSGLLISGVQPLMYTPDTVVYETKEESERCGTPLGCNTVIPPPAETWLRRGDNYYNITVRTWRPDIHELFKWVTQSFEFVED